MVVFVFLQNTKFTLRFSGGLTFDVLGKYLTSVADPKAKVTVRALDFEQIFISVGQLMFKLTYQFSVRQYSYFARIFFLYYKNQVAITQKVHCVTFWEPTSVFDFNH